MTEREPWMPTDQEIESALISVEMLQDDDETDPLAPIRTLIREAVEKAVAEAKFERAETVRLLEAERGLWDLERARHAREQVEFTGAALYEFGVSGDDAAPGEAPGNFLLRLIRESKATHAHEIEKAKLKARIEAMDEWGPCDCHQTRVDCPCCKQIKKLRAALAALEVGK